MQSARLLQNIENQITQAEDKKIIRHTHDLLIMIQYVTVK
jgi:hypothetical protein